LRPPCIIFKWLDPVAVLCVLLLLVTPRGALMVYNGGDILLETIVWWRLF